MHRLEGGKQSVSDASAGGTEIHVRRVVHRDDVVVPTPLRGLRSGEAQQGADEPIATGGDAERTRPPGAACRTEEHGLDVVGARVAGGNNMEPFAPSDALGDGKACVTGALHGSPTRRKAQVLDV
jgi:hypothetical protein